MQVAERVAGGAAALYTVANGATSTAILGTVATQAVTGGAGLDPALMASYGAIGALFSLYVWSTKGRTERCEKREDKLLDADGEKTATMKEVSSTLTKVAEGLLSAVESGKRTEAKLEAAVTELNAVKAALAELTRQVQRDLDARARGT